MSDYVKGSVLSCATLSCGFMVMYTDSGWAHVDTHGQPIHHIAEPKEKQVEKQSTIDFKSDAFKLERALVKIDRAEKKAAKANIELTKLQQEVARLRLENKIQLGWLNAEESYTRRYKALEARMAIIRDVTSDTFPEKYGEPGAYNWFGTKP